MGNTTTQTKQLVNKNQQLQKRNNKKNNKRTRKDKKGAEMSYRPSYVRGNLNGLPGR